MFVRPLISSFLVTLLVWEFPSCSVSTPVASCEYFLVSRSVFIIMDSPVVITPCACAYVYLHIFNMLMGELFNKQDKHPPATGLQKAKAVFLCHFCRVSGSRGPRLSSHIPCRGSLAGLRWRRESWSVVPRFYAIGFWNRTVRSLMENVFLMY